MSAGIGCSMCACEISLSIHRWILLYILCVCVYRERGGGGEREHTWRHWHRQISWGSVTSRLFSTNKERNVACKRARARAQVSGAARQ
jgi:hypothetical protein